jgi:hypothetical protein
MNLDDLNPDEWWLNIGDGNLTLNHTPCGDAIYTPGYPSHHRNFDSGVALAELLTAAQQHECPEDTHLAEQAW